MDSKKPPPVFRAVEICGILESDIEAGRLLPGQSIDEGELTRRFGVSRTPVREAIQQLTGRGLLRVLSRNGVHVARMSIPELRAMFEFMAELEGVCAKLAARRMSEASRQLLQKACDECTKAAGNSDVRAYTEANDIFHELLYRGAQNPLLAEQLRTIRRRSRVYHRSSFDRPTQMDRSAAEHREIATAVCAGDAVEAQRRMIEHIAVGGNGFAEFVSQLPPELYAFPGAEPRFTPSHAT